jgi:hypothetical protein
VCSIKVKPVSLFQFERRGCLQLGPGRGSLRTYPPPHRLVHAWLDHCGVDTGARLREREAGVFGCDPGRLSLLPRRPMDETPALTHILVV